MADNQDGLMRDDETPEEWGRRAARESIRKAEEVAAAKDQDAPIKLDENPNDPRTRIRKLNRIITGWQQHIDRMAKILGCFGIQDEVEEAAQKLKADHARLQQQVEKYEKALEHYADESKWFCNAVHIHKIDDPDCVATELNCDGGNGYDLARQVLDEAKEKK